MPLLFHGQPQDVLRHPEMREYRKHPVPVDARRVNERTEVSVSWQEQPLVASPGDWICSDGRSEWPVEQDIFAETYEQLPDGRWQKTATVFAVRLSEPFAVETLEGRAQGQAGDWLVQSAGRGEAWPIPAADFATTYERVGE